MKGDSKYNELFLIRKSHDELFEKKQNAWKKQQKTWERLQNLHKECETEMNCLKRRRLKLQQKLRRFLSKARYNIKSNNHKRANVDFSIVNSCRNQINAIKSKCRHMVYAQKLARKKHNEALKRFRRAKARYDTAKGRLVNLTESAKTLNLQIYTNKFTLACLAGVPQKFVNNVHVCKKTDGVVHIYFGGVGKPAGPGHGHYVMDQYSNIVYRRDPQLYGNRC